MESVIIHHILISKNMIYWFYHWSEKMSGNSLNSELPLVLSKTKTKFPCRYKFFFIYKYSMSAGDRQKSSLDMCLDFGNTYFWSFTWTSNTITPRFLPQTMFDIPQTLPSVLYYMIKVTDVTSVTWLMVAMAVLRHQYNRLIDQSPAKPGSTTNEKCRWFRYVHYTMSTISVVKSTETANRY